MKKLLAVLLVFTLTLCSTAFASSVGSGAPYEKAAEAMTMYHFITVSTVYGEENCEPHLMTKPLYSPEMQMIEYGTNNGVFQIVMFCDPTESGIIQIHILFKEDVEPYDAYAQLLGLICVFRGALTQEEKDALDVSLVTILFEALEQTDPYNPWESEIITVNDIVDITAYHNGITYAYRLDFRQPITAEYLDTEMMNLIGNANN